MMDRNGRIGRVRTWYRVASRAERATPLQSNGNEAIDAKNKASAVDTAARARSECAMTRIRTFPLAAAAAGLAALSIAAAAMASDRQVRSTSPEPAAWRAECGSCHVAYPPRLLPASSWRRIMQGLDRHFGVDATLDAGSAAAIATFLAENAARVGGKRAQDETLRITETRWFRHEHAEVSPQEFARASVRGPANCDACHRDAGRGQFDERSVRIPR